MAIRMRATEDDLRRVPDKGKAELVEEEILRMSPTGGIPGYAGGEIFAALQEYARRTRLGYAFPDNVGFLVQLPHRRSFSPDAAFYTGEMRGGEFLEGAPLFAIEVRSDSDYGPIAEQALAVKRADYFATGTQVVWDVDVLRSETMRVYRADTPERPSLFGWGELADAEPALPGWRFPVEDLFPLL